MKITMEIPEETVCVTVSIATQTDKNVVALGVFPVGSSDLKDGNTVDFKSSYDKMKETTEKGGAE